MRNCNQLSASQRGACGTNPTMESIVHICNGEKTTAALASVDLPGEIRTWEDALDQGPVLPVGDDAHYQARGEFWAGRGRGSAATIAQQLARNDQQIDQAASSDELILWFDHNLPDQIALVRLLSRLARSRSSAQLAIVSIDRHPDVSHFIALDQLNAEQLAQLWARRTPLSRDAIDEANAAWIAITSADPRALPLLMRRIKALPFLAGALERQLEELPDPTSGLTRTERELLAAMARGEGTLAGLVDAVRSIDPRYAVTALAASGVLAGLERIGYIVAAPNNNEAVRTEHPGMGAAAGDSKVRSISALGRQALSGTLDRVAQHGVDDWRGGVRLVGNGPVWRWDSRDRKLLER